MINWRAGAHGPCVNIDPSGRHVFGRYWHDDASGIMRFAGIDKRTLKCVVFVWPRDRSKGYRVA